MKKIILLSVFAFDLSARNVCGWKEEIPPYIESSLSLEQICSILAERRKAEALELADKAKNYKEKCCETINGSEYTLGLKRFYLPCCKKEICESCLKKHFESQKTFTCVGRKGKRLENKNFLNIDDQKRYNALIYFGKDGKAPANKKFKIVEIRGLRYIMEDGVCYRYKTFLGKIEKTVFYGARCPHCRKVFSAGYMRNPVKFITGLELSKKIHGKK